MKKVYYLMLLLTGCLVFQSCLKEEEDLFAENPSERMEKTLKEYREVLTSSANGWAMDYYAETNQSYGGYNYAMQFTDSSVKAYFELSSDVNESVESLYKLTSDDGPVLSFDTYNVFLHFFANPSPEMYQGYQGDHEFVLMGLSEDKNTIQLKGKKTGNRMTLTRLNESPSDYLSKVVAISSQFSAPAYGLTVNGQQIACSVSDNVLSYQYAGQDNAIVSGSVAFRYTTTGIKLYKETEIAGVLLDEWTLTGETMVSTNGNAVLSLVFPPINQQFVNGDWFVAYSQLGAFGQAYFDVAKAGLDAIGEELQFAFMGSMLYGKFGFNFISSGYGGLLGYDYQLIGDDKIALAFNRTGDGDGIWYHNNADFHYILNVFGYSAPRTFTLTTDDIKFPSYITFVEDGNPDNTFTLFAQQITFPFLN